MEDALYIAQERVASPAAADLYSVQPANCRGNPIGIARWTNCSEDTDMECRVKSKATVALATLTGHAGLDKTESAAILKVEYSGMKFERRTRTELRGLLHVGTPVCAGSRL